MGEAALEVAEHGPVRTLNQRRSTMEAGTHRSPGAAQSTGRSNNTIDNVRRFTTETKASFKTSELWLAVAAIVGILVAAATVDGAEGFGANQAWLYVAIVVSAYAISRGLAKSGSYEPYAVERDGDVRSNSAN
jgi:hypothetical protein